MPQTRWKPLSVTEQIRQGRIHRKTDGLPKLSNGKNKSPHSITITDSMITTALLTGGEPSLIRWRLQCDASVSFVDARQRIARLGQNLLASRDIVQSMSTNQVAAILAMSHDYIEHPKRYIRALANASEKATQHKNAPRHKNPSSCRDQMFLLQALGMARNSSRKLDKQHRKRLATDLRNRTGSPEIPQWITRPGPDAALLTRAAGRNHKKK